MVTFNSAIRSLRKMSIRMREMSAEGTGLFELTSLVDSSKSGPCNGNLLQSSSLNLFLSTSNWWAHRWRGGQAKKRLPCEHCWRTWGENKVSGLMGDVSGCVNICWEMIVQLGAVVCWTKETKRRLSNMVQSLLASICEIMIELVDTGKKNTNSERVQRYSFAFRSLKVMMLF